MLQERFGSVGSGVSRRPQGHVDEFSMTWSKAGFLALCPPIR